MGAATKKIQVGIVDDHSLLRKALAKLIGSFETYAVLFEGDNGKDIKTKITAHVIPDIIILDVNMPFTNSFQVLARLRASAETVRIPVIFVTAEPSGDVYPTVAKDPRAAHIKKPLDLDSFNSVVRLFLERYPYP